MVRSILFPFQLEEDKIIIKGGPISGVSNLDVVRFDGTNHVPAQADTIANSKFSGIAIDIEGSTADIVTSGLVEGFSGLTSGALYYLSNSTPGGITLSPTDIRMVVGIAISDTELVVNNRFNTSGKSLPFIPVTVTADYTASINELVLVNNTGNITVTLPDASLFIGEMISIKKVSENNARITIDSDGGTVDGDTSTEIRFFNTSVMLISDGTNWNIS